ncbi:autotransporter domain-containing protein [Pandoraea sp. NPDC087047]|uniref:autotransporter domain-containing protein n=1 Tax=Pandoraea sp. NPDC087047 TaxID=3364390 RepID=UPI00380FB5B4
MWFCFASSALAQGVPTVTSVLPASGPTAGGTAVTITGTHFTGATTVQFGGLSATSMTVVSDTQITAVSPGGAGAVNITVMSPGGTSLPSGNSQFTYLSPPTGVSSAITVAFDSAAVPIDLAALNNVPDLTSVAVASAPSHGTATVASRSTLTYAPATGYSGSDSFTYIMTNAAGTSAPATITVTVAAPTITLSPLTQTYTASGAAYRQTVVATGGSAPYTYSISSGSLPTGLTLNSATGTIAGTATRVGVFSFTLKATDASQSSATVGLSIQVTVPILSLTPATLADASLDVAYSQSLSGSGGVAPYTFSASGLPSGLSLVGSTISGRPTQAGAFSVTVRMTDSSTGVGAPYTLDKLMSLTVNAAPMTISPTMLPAPVAGQHYSQTIVASGGMAPYRYAVTSGALPNGLSLDASSGVLSGTPTAMGMSNFTITAFDSSGPGTSISISQSFSFNIANQVASAPPVQTQTMSNAPVTIRATANAVGGPFTSVALSSPPTSGTAVVQGENIIYTPTPTTSGDVTFTYTLTNAVGTSAPIRVTVTVSAVPVTAAPLEMSVAANGTADFDITAGATGGPFTGANVVSVSPANAGTVTLVSTPASAAAAGGSRFVRAAAAPGNTYTLRFVPAAAFAGAAVIAYTLSNASATSAPGTARVTVAPRKDPTTDPDVTGLIGAQVEAARRFATTQVSNYNQRLEALHGTGRAPSSNGLNVVLPSADRGNRRDLSRCQDVVGITDRDACLRGEVSPTALSNAKRLDVRDKTAGGTGGVDGPDLPGAGAGDDKRFAYWTAGSVDFGFANTAAQRAGFTFTTGGVTMGADYRFSDQFSLGAGVGYGHDSTDVGSSGTRSTGDSYSGALYASFRPIPTLFVDAVAGFGTLSFDSRRWVVDASDFASGTRRGQQFFASLSAGYEYRSDDWLFSPYGRLTASRSTLDQYSESGAGLNALTYFKQNVNTLSGTLGVRAGFAKATRIGTFSPYIRVELQHDFNAQSLAGLAYADLASGGPAYFVPGSPYGSDRVQVGAGTKLRTGVLVFGLDYSVTTGMGGLQQGVRLTFAAPF